MATETQVQEEIELGTEANKLLHTNDGDTERAGQVPPPSAPDHNDDEKSPLVRKGRYIEFQFGEKIINLKVNDVTDHHKNTDTKDFALLGRPDKGVERTKTLDEVHEENVSNLMPDSTNAWLYVEDSHTEDGGDTDKSDDDRRLNCSDNLINKLIAFFVIGLQIASYIIMASMLSKGRSDEFAERRKASRGPYAALSEDFEVCMNFSTGGLTSLLLVGFLWADVVNILFIATRKVTIGWIGASTAVLAELITAIVCGFVVGLYSENDFDAIGGAVGILFVHDLDEKVFASMESFRGQKWAATKKFIAISLWLLISFLVAGLTACEFQEGGALGTGCLVGQFSCGDAQCIWEGAVCNGVEDCDNGFDEQVDPFRLDAAGNPMTCDFTLVDCGPEDEFFRCNEDGSCLPISKKCDGILDCPAGSDESREQNCPAVIRSKECPMALNISNNPEFSDDFHKVWEGSFKCNNGQCIDAMYACDGVPDCVDGSDEYPEFNKRTTYPFMRNCPYDQLVTCEASEVLCKVDGQCISKRQQCDGIKDCSDGSDEAACEIREEYDCWSSVANEKSFQCGQPFAKVNDTHALYFKTGNDTEYRALDGWSSKNKQTLKSHFDDVHGKCLPLSYRCDGVYDCGEDDISDEEACELFACKEGEYRCKDSGKCIALAFMCDGENDCDSGEDEVLSTCNSLGVDLSENECTKQGFFYQCKGYADICLYQDEICDGHQDCPGSDDETDEALCNTAKGDAVNEQGSTTLTCGETSTGFVSLNSQLSFKFTLPEGSTNFKITTCVTEHKAGAGYMWLENEDQTLSKFGEDDGTKCPCGDRVSLIAGTSDGFAAGTEYDFTYIAIDSGNYALEVECGTGSISRVGVCVSDNVPQLDDLTIFNAVCDGSTANTGVYDAYGEQAAEVWRFTPTGSEGMHFDGCESSFDTFMQIWNSNREALFYSDDHPGCTVNSYASYVGVTNQAIEENPGDMYLAIGSPYFSDGPYSFVCGTGLGDFDPVKGAGGGDAASEAHGDGDTDWEFDGTEGGSYVGTIGQNWNGTQDQNGIPSP